MKPSSPRFVSPLTLAVACAIIGLVPLAIHLATERSQRPKQEAVQQSERRATDKPHAADLAVTTAAPEPLISTAAEAATPAFRLLSRLPKPVVIANPADPVELIPSAVSTITSSSLIDPLSLSIIRNAKAGDVLGFPHPQGGWLSARVAHRTDDSAAGTVSIAGEIAERAGHRFTFQFNGDAVSGMVLLPDEKRALLVQQDDSGRVLLQDKPIDTVVCFGMPLAPGQERFARNLTDVEYNVTVPILDSRPSATAVLYLDFDGEAVTETDWNSTPIIALPAVMQGSPITPAQITTVWEMVAEDFRPFNVSVTTNLSRYTNAPVGQRMRCIQTPTNTAAPGAGGVAFLNSFSTAGGFRSANVPCWSFNSNNPWVMAMTISHELGHTLGLLHDGRIALPPNSAEEYYAGHGSGPTAWGPLMGAPFSRRLTQWSKGDYFRASRTEDDIALIARPANSLTFIPDTVGNNPANSTLVSGNLFGQINQSGVIIQSTDVDYYRFTTAGGTLNVSCAPNPTEPNLKTMLELRDSNNLLVTASSPAGSLFSGISRSIPQGTYYLVVRSGSEGTPTVNPPSGFVEYGSIGSYSLTGTFVGLPAEPLIVQHPDSVSADEGKAATFRVSSLSNSPVKYQWYKVVDGVDQKVAKATSATYRIGATNASHIGEYKCYCTNATGVSISDSVTLDVFLKPRITTQPSDVVGQAGDDIFISPAYLGDGPLTFRWFKNNALIVGADSDTLPLADLIWSDAGKYKLEISNRIAKVTSRTVTIQVLSAPVFLSMPSILAIRSNSSATLTPTVAGTSPFSYRWFKNDVELSGQTGRSLKLLGQPTTPGLYKVHVTNSVGETTSAETEVFVDDRLAITIHPVAGGPYEAGDSATLTVETIGSEPKTYQWQLNRKDIIGATDQTLHIPSLDWFNNGNYRVIVRNRVSSVTSKQTRMSISSPPVFTIHPVDSKGARRGKITLKSKAVGTTKLTYQWRFNGVAIPKATRPNLTLTRLDAVHEGIYDVVVTNPKGSTTSLPANLIVEDAPSIVLHPQPAFVAVGDTLTATVSAAGAPVLTYQWQRNKRNIIGATDQDLILSDAQLANTGSYRVIVTNDVGKVTSKAATIRVMIPPSIVTNPVNVTIYESQTATFRVKAAGSTPLKYRWLRDGVQVSTAATLTMKNVALARAGDYSVEVSNSVGTVTSASATLTVVPIPPPTATLLVPVSTRPGRKFAVTGANLRWITSVKVGTKSVGFVVTRAQDVVATLPTNATSGQVRLTSRGGTVSPPSNLTVNNTAVNDHFRNSIVLTGGKATSSSDTTDFSREANEPVHALSGDSGSAWWRWTAPATRRYSVSTWGSAFDTVLAIYSGDNIANLGTVAFNDDAPGGGRHSLATFTAFEGAAYRIAVAGFLGAEGYVALEIGPEVIATSPLALGSLKAESNTALPEIDGLMLAENPDTAAAMADDEVVIGATAFDDEEPTSVQIWHPALPEALGDATTVTTAFTASLEQADGTSSEDSFAWTLYNHAEDPLLALQFQAADGSIHAINAQGQTWTTDAKFVAGGSFRFEVVTDLATGRFSLVIDGVTQLHDLPLELGTANGKIADMSATWTRAPETAPAAMRFKDLEIWTN